MFKIIVKFIISQKDPFSRSIRLSPLFIGLAFFVVILSFLFKTPLGKKLSLSTDSAITIAIILAAILGFLAMALLKYLFAKKKSNNEEEVFRYIQIGTACYVALAQGANDVANAIGPLAVIYFLVKTGEVGTQVPVPGFLLIFGGIGIALGIAMAGHRVMDTIGRRITTLTNTRGFAVEFAAATTVMVASKMGLPVSTTHAAVGGVMGVGLARGIEAVNFRIIFQIMIYWVLTVPVAAVTSMLLFKILQLFL
jgi:PiT family inorganic phosphate transporter